MLELLRQGVIQDALQSLGIDRIGAAGVELAVLKTAGVVKCEHTVIILAEISKTFMIKE